MLIVVDWDAIGVEPPGLRVLDVVVSVGARLLAAVVVFGVPFKVASCMVLVGVIVGIEDVVPG